MEIIEQIKINLSAIGEEYDSLKPFMKTWLEKVETEIQSRYNTQAEAAETLRSLDYSVKSIASSIGASRTTMYNHEQLLKRYIEHSAAVASASNPLSLIDKVQAEKSLLQNQVTKLMERDVDMELMRLQNRELSTSLEGKNTEIERLQTRISELSEENRKLKSGTSAKPTVKAFRKK